MKINVNYKPDEFPQLEMMLAGGVKHWRHVAYFQRMTKLYSKIMK